MKKYTRIGKMFSFFGVPDSTLSKFNLVKKTRCPSCSVYTVKIFNRNPNRCLLHVRTCRGKETDSIQVFNMDSDQIHKEEIPLTKVFETIPERFREKLLNSIEAEKGDRLDLLLYLLAAGLQNPLKIISAAYVAELKKLTTTNYCIKKIEKPLRSFWLERDKTESGVPALAA